jgi:hypothetical protein
MFRSEVSEAADDLEELRGKIEVFADRCCQRSLADANARQCMAQPSLDLIVLARREFECVSRI